MKISILKTKLESTLSHITVTCETSAKKKQNPIKVPRIGETAAELTNLARKDQSFLAPIIIRVKDFFHNFTILKSYLDIKYLNNLEQILLAPIIIRDEHSETNQDFHS